MLQLFGFLAALLGGSALYPALDSTNARFTPQVILSLIVLGLGLVALVADRVLDQRDTRLRILAQDAED